MTWGEMRTRVVERLGEYTAGLAEAAGNTSVAESVLYSRLTASYRRMIDVLAAKNPIKVTSLQTVAYAASTESVALPAGLQFRPIFGIERLLSSGDYEPLEGMEQYQDERSRAPFTSFPLSTSYGWMGSTYGYKIENTLLYILPKPTEALTLRVKYCAAVATLTVADAAASPSFIPVEHQEVLALDAAMSLLREVGGNETLERELMLLWKQFTDWATRDPKRGPRFVLETQ
jgi:hypothetical protein